MGQDAATKPEATAPARTGACMDCLEKHLLAVEGYAEELREDPSRKWERKQLRKNLKLAEDHALALGDEAARAAIRSARVAADAGAYAESEALYERFFPTSCPTCPGRTAEHAEHTEHSGEF